MFGVESDALAFAAVAACTASLLIVAFEAFRYVVVNDETHIGLVDAHAESDGGNDDIHFFHQEFVLVLGTHFVVQSRMVGKGFDSVELQQLGQLLHAFAGEAVDDAAFAFVLSDEFHYLTVELDRFRGFGAYLVVEVRPVERGDEEVGVLHAQVLDDVLLHLGGGGGCKGEDGNMGVDGIHGVA